MIVPRRPNRELFIIGSLEFTIRDANGGEAVTQEDAIVFAWVEVGNEAMMVQGKDPNWVTEKACEIIKRLSGENGNLYFRQKDVSSILSWEVGV